MIRNVILNKKLPNEKKIRDCIKEGAQYKRDVERIEEITGGIAEFLSELVAEISFYRSKINLLSDAIEVGSGSLGPKDILSNMMLTMQKVFNCDGATIWEITPDQETLIPVDSYNGLASIAMPCMTLSQCCFQLLNEAIVILYDQLLRRYS